jgi:hypothetical protein
VKEEKAYLAVDGNLTKSGTLNTVRLESIDASNSTPYAAG